MNEDKIKLESEVLVDVCKRLGEVSPIGTPTAVALLHWLCGCLHKDVGGPDRTALINLIGTIVASYAAQRGTMEQPLLNDLERHVRPWVKVQSVQLNNALAMVSAPITKEHVC